MKLWIDAGTLANAETLFGVPPLERMRRAVGKAVPACSVTVSGPAGSRWPGAETLVDPSPLGSRLRKVLAHSVEPLVVIDGANVIDPRLIEFLGRTGDPCLAQRGEGGARAVAMRLTPTLAGAIPPEASDLIAVADALEAAGSLRRLDESTFPDYIDKLRRRLPYWVYSVSDARARRMLERQLFWDNYKGSTDLLTRYVYPPLVWPLVRMCTRLGIHPNAVTVLSIVLAFAAVPLWMEGHWFWGFVCAYAMSVLDSVDGKVARLTFTDSSIGNVLDHGLDIVHPPFWYYAWAIGLGGTTWDDPLYEAAISLIVFYVADRIVLGIAKRRLRQALHASTRLDEKVRSIIARRNITMSIMAGALLVGGGAAGLIIVTVWQGLTLAWHTSRTVWLGYLAPQKK